MVQDILSAMDSDEVNSISDTVEAGQVATIIKNCYNDITTDVELPDDYSLLQLDASGDVLKPVTMTIPDAYTSIEWIRYNKVGSGTTSSSTHEWTSPDGITIHFGTDEATFSGSGSSGGTNQQFKLIKYLPRQDFLNVVLTLDSEADEVVTYNILENSRNIPLLCRNDKAPDYWTTFDNRTILFDSYDNTVDSTLQTSKTMCWGKQATSFTLSNSWVIPLDDKTTSYLYNEAKATAFSELKQVTNTRAEKKSREAKIKTQKTKVAAPYDYDPHSFNPSYGRNAKPSR
jgi:hypothetical protein